VVVIVVEGVVTAAAAAVGQDVMKKTKYARMYHQLFMTWMPLHRL